jgi:hypothetical protein
VRCCAKGFTSAWVTASDSRFTRSPSLGRTGTAPLIEGDVIAIEPGTVIRGVGGTRVEDLLIVTAQGSERLTRSFPYGFGPIARASDSRTAAQPNARRENELSHYAFPSETLAAPDPALLSRRGGTSRPADDAPELRGRREPGLEPGPGVPTQTSITMNQRGVSKA